MSIYFCVLYQIQYLPFSMPSEAEAHRPLGPDSLGDWCQDGFGHWGGTVRWHDGRRNLRWYFFPLTFLLWHLVSESSCIPLWSQHRAWKSSCTPVSLGLGIIKSSCLLREPCLYLCRHPLHWSLFIWTTWADFFLTCSLTETLLKSEVAPKQFLKPGLSASLRSIGTSVREVVWGVKTAS